MRRLAAAGALAGGTVLLAMATMTVLSVAGRALTFAGLGAVPGDFELVEAGLVFVVLAFMPWCQIADGHARVDILADRLPGAARAVLRIGADAVFFVVATVIAWRLWLGLGDRIAYPQTTLILQFPVWWAYLAAACAAMVWVAVAGWCAVRSALGMAPARGAR